MHARVALAGDGGIAFLAQPEPLQIKCAEGEDQQHHGKDCRTAGVMLGADDGEEDFGREHVEIAAKDQRVAEIGHAFDEAQQEGIGQTGAHQRPGHGAEGLPAVGTQGLGGLFHRGADAFDHPDHHEKGNGGKGQHLRDQHA
jgi:hypothetical protein